MGKEVIMCNPKYIAYICDCGEDTEYGIYRLVNDDEWCIDSCCGGCNSANNIKYCPFCGEKIEVKGDDLNGKE